MIVASLRLGFDPSTEIRELARPVAEAQVDVRRVRHARHRLLSDASSDPHYEFEPTGGRNWSRCGAS